MPGEQYLAYYEEDERGTPPDPPTYRFVPVVEGLQPKFDPKDEPRKEFMGAPTALGDTSVRRKESSFAASIKAAWRPGVELGCWLKHLFGVAGVRAVVDTSARKGILYPAAMPYGAGNPLDETAIALVPNTDEEGETKSQVFGGTRWKTVTITVKGSDDVMIQFEGGGAGDWIGPVDQAAVDSIVWPAASPFLSCNVKCYAGTGISRTGSAPDFTAIGPGTMKQFRPDEITIKITNGLEDKFVANGVQGPSQTNRNSQFSVEIDINLDYRDPSSGFSSADQYKALYSGPNILPILVVFEHDDLAGSGTEKYAAVLDCPAMMVQSDPPERNNEGKTPTMKMKLKSLYDATAQYPCALLTVDKAAEY